MASPAPSKSQPLHNFELPELKWNKVGQSSGHKKRRRSMKSPSRRPNASSASPLLHPALQEPVAATPPPRLPSPLRDSPAVPWRDSPFQGDCLMKQSPVRGESSKPSPNREELKNSPVGGDSEKLSLLREEALRPFQKRDWSLESEALRKGKGSVIEYHRNPFKISAFANLKNMADSWNSEQGEKKVEKKSKTTEDDGGNKRSKILIKIHSKSNEEEEEKSKEGVLMKIGNNDEHEADDQMQDEGKMSDDFDDETKIWELRPRKLAKCKSQKATLGGEKGNIFRLPEKSKSQPQIKNANKSGVKEGKSGGSGGEKEKGGVSGGDKKEKGEGFNGGEKKEKVGGFNGGEKKEKGGVSGGDKKEKGGGLNGGEKKKKGGVSGGDKKEKGGGFIGGDKKEKGGVSGGDKKEKGGEKIKEKGGSSGGEKKGKGGKQEKIEEEKGEKQEKIEEEKGEKKEKRKLSISIALTKEEIEEDIYALTGSKPARRPKKRAKNVQKQVDYAFPGLWLVSITPESYKVSESSMKG